MSAMAAAFMPQALSGFSRMLQPLREYGGQLLAHWRGLTMASRRNAGKFFRALKFCGERVPARTDWAAHDAPTKLVVSMANGILPGSIIGHRSFNAKEPLDRGRRR